MIISIDVGTSYSSICISGPDGKAQPVNTSTGTSMYGDKYSLPSAVFVEDNGKVLVGQAAMNNRKRKPQNFRMEFKRDLGQDIPVFLGNASFMPEDFYTEIFRHMTACLEKLGIEFVEKVYLTCPAAFGKKKRDKIIAAAKAAGLFDTELVDEPTAAAMSYCAEGILEDDQKFMVYDFGGGTFDVSLIHYADGEFRQLTEPHGLERCGGMDMDRLIFQDMLSCIDAETLGQLRDNSMYHMRLESQLAELALKAKHHLSAAEIFEEDIQVGFDMFPYELTVERFNGMIAGLVGQTVTACREILQSAGLQATDLSSVLMVGGTSRIPLVQEMVKQFAGDVPVFCSDDLELAVARGALHFQEHRETDECTGTAKLYWEAAMRGDAEAQYRLGRCYMEGMGVWADYEEAAKWYGKAAGQDYAAAQYQLGECYYHGWGVPIDRTESAKWYQKAVKGCLKAAEQGDAEAQYILGDCYRSGRGILENREKSVGWYREAALRGHARAQSCMGSLYECGLDVPQRNERKAAKLYGEAAEQGDAGAQFSLEMMESVPEDEKTRVKFAYILKRAEQGNAAAQISLGNYYMDGEIVSQDKKEAGKWYQKAVKQIRKAAEQGNVEAQIRLGDCYREGKVAVVSEKEAEKWYQRAAKQIRKAADQDNIDAQIYLGDCYSEGKIVPKDEEEAGKWYQKALKQIRKAAEQGNIGAQLRLADYLVNFYLGVVDFNYKGRLTVPQDKKEAEKWYQEAAEHGDPEIAFKLGERYQSSSNGFRMDKKEEMKWYLKAASQGHMEAQYKVGEFYAGGVGVRQDMEEAVKWYLKAANQGHLWAQYTLAEKYLHGYGVPKDLREAAKWYRKGAERGHASAQCALGDFYWGGIGGLPKDRNEAIKWYKRAANLGDEEAQRRLGKMSFDDDDDEDFFDDDESIEEFFDEEDAGLDTLPQGIVSRCITIIAEVLNVDSGDISLYTTYNDLGADSLDIFQIIMQVEEEFDIEITEEDRDNNTNTTVGDLVYIVQLKLNS